MGVGWKEYGRGTEGVELTKVKYTHSPDTEKPLGTLI
jgi:hypothetical protein